MIGADIVAASQELEKVDLTQLPESAKNLHTALKNYIAKDLYALYYAEGYRCYSVEDYAAAAENLQKVVDYDIAYRDGYAAYYLAQSYRKNGDLVSAKPYYQYVIDNYPNTERAATALIHVKAE